MNENQIRSALNKLESTGEISIKSTNRYSVITLLKWGEYEKKDSFFYQQTTSNPPTSHQQATNKPPTNHQQTTNKPPRYNNDNNYNNGYNDKKSTRYARNKWGGSFLEESIIDPEVLEKIINAD